MARGICEHQAKLLYIVLFLNPQNRPKPRLGAISSISTKKWAFPAFDPVLEWLCHAALMANATLRYQIITEPGSWASGGSSVLKDLHKAVAFPSLPQ
jgi:hypothetical protein